MSDSNFPPSMADTEWYLEGFVENPPVLRRFPVRPFPFRVGRGADLELRLNYTNVSRVHAEIFLDGGELQVRDLQSTNGTYVNHRQIFEPVPLMLGDIVGFADFEFRVIVENQSTLESLAVTQVQEKQGAGFLASLNAFEDMMRCEAVLPLFQPIVSLETRTAVAHELLGRGSMAGLVTTPRELFTIASGIGIEHKLSALFRGKGIEAAASASEITDLFVNIHPREMTRQQDLVRSLADVRSEYPELRLVAEVHESAVTDLADMKSLRTALHDLEIRLAYDDFGVGQPRLIELAQVPPDFLKFDMSLVQDINSATAQLQQMVAMLVKFAEDVGAQCIAEGVETEEEARACLELGFACAQGFHFGRPARASAFAAEKVDEDTATIPG